VSDELRAALTAFETSDYSEITAVEVLRRIVDAAKRHLAEHPADDGEPVTEDWLVSIGFWRRGGDELCSPRDGRWMLIHDADPVPGYSSRWNLSFPGCQQGLGYDLPTRGDVRRLLTALNVPFSQPQGA
jgi:hypothetical protein